MIQISGNPIKKIEQLKRLKKDFKVTSTTNSKLIEWDGWKYLYSDEHFNKKYLHFFQKMKKEVQKNIDEKNIIVPKFEKSKYFHFKEFEKIGAGEYKKFYDCVELDINKAYYNVLYNLGYISEKFYKLCIELPKKIRLALVGTLATQKTILFYENGVISDDEIKEDKILRRVFFQLVKIVDECLYTLSYFAKENFLFYWVDGIYLKNYKDIKKHQSFIENKYNLTFSFELKKKVIILNTSKNSTNIGVYGLDKSLKIFSLPCVFTK